MPEKESPNERLDLVACPYLWYYSLFLLFLVLIPFMGFLMPKKEDTSLAKLDLQPVTAFDHFMRVKALTKPEQADNAVDHYIEARKALKQAEDRRKNITQKILKAKYEVDAEARLVTDPLKQVIEHMEGLLEDWEKKERVKAVKAAVKRAEKEEDKGLAADLVHFAKTQNAYTKRGIRWGKKVTARVVDWGVVPTEFLQLDEKKVKNAILNGRVIPGVKAVIDYKVGTTGK